MSTSENPSEVKTAETRFWQLYWGELAMVENGGIKTKNGGVEGAMVRFGEELKKQSRSQLALQGLSLDLAHVCRDSL